MQNSWCNGRDRIVVSTSRCGRDNPGSNPGHGRDKHESLVRQISYFCKNKCWYIFIRSCFKIIEQSNTDDLLSWLMQNSWCNDRDRIVVSTSRCGRDNPGSNPGHGRDKHESLVRRISYFCKSKCWYIFIRSCLQLIEKSNTDDLLSWLMQNSWCNGRDRIVVRVLLFVAETTQVRILVTAEIRMSLWCGWAATFAKINVAIYLYGGDLK